MTDQHVEHARCCARAIVACIDAASPFVMRKTVPYRRGLTVTRARLSSVHGERAQRGVAASWCAKKCPYGGSGAARILFITGPMTHAPTLALDKPRWSIHAACPAGWRQQIALCGGGYFHSSRGLLASAPAGEPIFLDLWDGEQLLGVATGVRFGGAGSATPRHVYFPTLPAVASRKSSEFALASLVERLREDGMAEVVLDSFDAQMVPGALLHATELRHRREYTVDLDASPDYLLSQMAPRHRRQIERGDAERWSCRVLRVDELRTPPTAVKPVALFGMRRGESFATHLHNVAALAGSELQEPSGATVFAAFDGQKLLAAALIGWANRRAYCLSGGCVPTGDDCAEAIWLHWQILRALRAEGFHRYNLGGSPPAAVSPTHPANGMHRFKMGFAPRVVECYSVRWALDDALARVRHQTGWSEGVRTA